MKVSEKWGTDVDAATELALKELKLSKEEADIEILEESSKGFFGLGSKLAKVRVTPKDYSINGKEEKEKASIYDIDEIIADLPENRVNTISDDIKKDYDKYEQEEIEDAKAAKEAKAAKAAKAVKNRKNDRPENRKKDVSFRTNTKEKTEEILLYEEKDLKLVKEHPVKDFLKDITEKMGLDLTFEVKTGKKIIHVNISGEDTGTIIGKRGQTLDAVQYLTSLAVNKDEPDYIRVVLDAENYRAKRERTLTNLANRLAGKVERTNRSVSLEPMNPYERKVIHSTLQNNPKVKTRSEGKDPYRKVIIEKK